MTYTTLNTIIRNWIDAFNGPSVDNLLALYHDDAIHYSPRVKREKPGSEGWLRGKPALREWWEDKLTEFPNLHYEYEEDDGNPMVRNNEAMFRYNRTTAPGESGEESWEYLRIVDNGLIVESRVLEPPYSWPIPIETTDDPQRGRPVFFDPFG